jgi:hypothetical protein
MNEICSPSPIWLPTAFRGYKVSIKYTVLRTRKIRVSRDRIVLSGNGSIMGHEKQLKHET